MRRRHVGGLVVTLAILLASHGWADTIRLASGEERTNVDVTSATWESVVFRQGNLPPQNLDGVRVASLERTSNYLNPVRAALARGDLQAALKNANDAIKFGNDWEKAEAYYYAGKIYVDAGQAAKAIPILKKYLEEFGPKRDFFVPHVTYTLGRAYLQQNQASQANSQFSQLTSKFGGGVWENKAKIGQAEAILGSDGDLLSARRELTSVRNDRNAPQPIKDEATVLYGRVLIQQGNHDQAIRELEDAFFDKQNVKYSQYQAEASAAIGDAYRARDGKANLEEAELWYLRATLFGRNYPQVYRHAAEGLAAVYKQLGKDARAQFWQARAQGS